MTCWTLREIAWALFGVFHAPLVRMRDRTRSSSVSVSRKTNDASSSWSMIFPTFAALMPAERRARRPGR